MMVCLAQLPGKKQNKKQNNNNQIAGEMKTAIAAKQDLIKCETEHTCINMCSVEQLLWVSHPLCCY